MTTCEKSKSTRKRGSLLEAHGAKAIAEKAIAEAAQNAIELEANLAAYRRRHEAHARTAPKLKLAGATT
jgi:hypothetical protein